MPLRADGFASRAFRSPGSRIAASARLPESFDPVAFVSAEAPRSQLRDSSGFAPDSLGALVPNLSLLWRADRPLSA